MKNKIWPPTPGGAEYAPPCDFFKVVKCSHVAYQICYKNMKLKMVCDLRGEKKFLAADPRA